MLYNKDSRCCVKEENHQCDVIISSLWVWSVSDDVSDVSDVNDVNEWSLILEVCPLVLYRRKQQQHKRSTTEQRQLHYSDLVCDSSSC